MNRWECFVHICAGINCVWVYSRWSETCVHLFRHATRIQTRWQTCTQTCTVKEQSGTRDPFRKGTVRNTFKEQSRTDGLKCVCFAYTCYQFLRILFMLYSETCDQSRTLSRTRIKVGDKSYFVYLPLSCSQFQYRVSRKANDRTLL